MAPNSSFCPETLYGGGCKDPSCSRQHDVRICELCAVICAPANNFESHIKGRQHLANATDAVPLQEASSRVKRCPVCFLTVSLTAWNSHLGGESHRKHQELASLRAAYEQAERDKQGVSISHVDSGVDFGLVSLDQAARSMRIELSVSTELHRVTIVRTEVRSRVPNHASLFTVILNHSTPTLAPGTQVRFPIIFRHDQRGRYEARLEFTFQGPAKQPFVIARSLVVVVGESSDHESLKSVAPYVRTRRAPWRYGLPVLPGEPPQSFPVPWSRELLPFPIPRHLAATLKSGSPMEVSARLRDQLFHDPLSPANHQSHFATLLWIEESRMVEDLRIYDMVGVQFTKEGRLFGLQVYGLAEGRPSVAIGDIIMVQAAGEGAGQTYKGVVHDIRQEEVRLSFHPSFQGLGGRFNVCFQLNRTPLRRQHQALVATIPTPERLLFPVPGHEGLERTLGVVDSRIPLFNKSIGTNGPQLQAVQSILHLRAGAAPFIIFGPPGTGKTVTIVEAIRQIFVQQPRARILACAPSNSAADILAQRLLALSPEEMFRCNAATRDRGSVPEEIVPYTFLRGNCYGLPPLDTLTKYRVIISTCSNASFAYNIGIPAGHFSHVFVDEAGQASEPELLVAIKPLALEQTRVVLSGDPKQLGPVIRSSIAREFGMDKSYLERLMERPIYSGESGRGTSFVKLVKNYRSHEAILRYPNVKFYDGELEVCGPTSSINSFLGSSQLVSARFPVVFHAISGRNEREASSPSYFNVDEAIQVKAYIVSLLQDHRHPLQARDVGVIAPYHAQVRKIRKLLHTSGFVDVKVGSVEEFQGQERRVIIISTVRSSTDLLAYDAKFALGFLSNARRFNVAVTRAKALLVVIGDAAILSVDPLWRGFMNHVHVNGGWRGDAPTWDVHAPVLTDADYADELREAIAADMNAVLARLPADEREDVEAEANADLGFWQAESSAADWA